MCYSMLEGLRLFDCCDRVKLFVFVFTLAKALLQWSGHRVSSPRMYNDGDMLYLTMSYADGRVGEEISGAGGQDSPGMCANRFSITLPMCSMSCIQPDKVPS